jgi:2'-5' RNA ligase
MPIAIVTCPEIPTDELKWIQDLRHAHLASPEADLAPHVTLVFPADVVADENLMMHMYGVAGSTQPFETIFRIAAPVADPIKGGWAVQLLPDQGLSKLMRMHNFLYTGPFDGTLNLDVPYVPHLTLARSATSAEAKGLCDELNSGVIEVSAQVKAVEVLTVDGDKIETQAQYELEG